MPEIKVDYGNDIYVASVEIKKQFNSLTVAVEGVSEIDALTELSRVLAALAAIG